MNTLIALTYGLHKGEQICIGAGTVKLLSTELMTKVHQPKATYNPRSKGTRG